MSGVGLSSLVLKTSIDPSLYGHVDLALKRLKLVSRRLSSTLTMWGEESRVLDRLYYKGKNQHRTSLFWRHVEEMRRFCLRIDSLDLLGILNRLRHSFYDSTSYDKWVFYFFEFVCDDNNLYASSQNILKGSWTHTPQAGDLRTTTRTFTPICQLLLRVRSPHSGYLSINWGVLMSHRLVKDSRVPIGS